jgi:hypothetical protein
MDDADLLDLKGVDIHSLDAGLEMAQKFGCRTKIASDL